MGKQTKIDFLFKRKSTTNFENNGNEDLFTRTIENPLPKNRPSKSQRVERQEVGNDLVERDPGKMTFFVRI